MSAPKGPAPTGGAGDKPGKARDNFIAKAAGAVIASGIAWSLYKSIPSFQGGAEHVEEPLGAPSSGGENFGSAVDDLGSEAKEKTDEVTSSLEKKGTEYKHKAEDFGSAVTRKADSVTKEGKEKANEASAKLQGIPNSKQEKTDEVTSSLGKKGTEYKHKAEDFGSAVTRKANSVTKEGKKKANEATAKLQGIPNYEIVRGDTLYTISRKYEVSVEVLKDVNGLFGDHIVAGEKLIIPNK